MPKLLHLLAIVLLFCPVARGAGDGALADIELVIDDEVIIAPAKARLTPYNMLRGPDGAIWVNTGEVKPGLFKSTDEGRTWKTVPVRLTGVAEGQHLAGFYITRDGRFLLVHQLPPPHKPEIPPAYVSISSDGGGSWRTSKLDQGRFAPGAPQDPYNAIEIAWCHPNFVERPDGTVFFSASMRYDDWDDYLQADQSRPGIRDVMVRSRDGGMTWGAPTIVHQHATEPAYAVAPTAPPPILAAPRIQRKALPGENLAAIRKRSAMDMTPPSYMPNWAYKNGILLESTDGGRSFREVPAGLFGFASYRWSVVWTKANWVLLVGVGGQNPGEKEQVLDSVARVSLDGGRTWLDGSAAGTSAPNRARRFSVVPAYRDIGKRDHYSVGVPVTLELSHNRFLTLASYKKDRILRGRFWHLENVPTGK